MSAFQQAAVSASFTEGRKRVIPWVEKYRPDKVDEIAHQDEVVKTLKNSILQGNLPHLLFHGPPGTGKIKERFYHSVYIYFCIDLTNTFWPRMFQVKLQQFLL